MRFFQLNIIAKFFSIVLIIFISFLFIFTISISYKPIKIKDLSYINKSLFIDYGIDLNSIGNILLSFNRLNGNFELLIEDINTNDFFIPDVLLGFDFKDLLTANVKPEIIKIYDAEIKLDINKNFFPKILLDTSNNVNKSNLSSFFSKFEIVEINNSKIKFNNLKILELNPVDIKITSFGSNPEVSISIGNFKNDNKNSLFLNFTDSDNQFNIVFKSDNFDFSDVFRLLSFDNLDVDDLIISSMGTISFNKDFKIKKINAKFNSNSIKFKKVLESREFTIVEEVDGKVELSDFQNLNANLNFIHNTSNLKLSIKDQPMKGKILNIFIDNINTENLKKFWPNNFKVSARNWVDQNLNAELENINLNFLLSDDNFEVNEFTGFFEFNNGMISYLRGMPRILELSGKSEILSEKLVFNIDKGYSKNLFLKDSKVEIFDLDQPVENASLELNIISKTRDLEKYLSYSPIKKTNYQKLKNIDGQMDSVLKMEFPLLLDLKAEEIKFELQSEFQDANIYNIFDNNDLNELKLKILLNPKRLIYFGSAKINEIDLDIQGTEDYDINNEKVVIKFILKSNDLNQYLNEYAESFAGEIPFEINYKIDKNINSLKVSGFGNMEKLKIEDSFLGTSFDSNLDGELKFDLLIDHSIPKNGNFVVDSDMLKINIKRDYKSDDEYSYILNKFKTPNQDFRGNLDFGDVNNLKINGKMVTLDLASKTSKFNNIKNLNFEFNVEKLFFSNTEISNPILNGVIMDGEFENLKFLKIGNDTNHEIRIYETNGVKTLAVKSDNASDLLGFIKKDIKIKNGDLSIDAKKEGDSYAGTLVMKDFIAYDTPIFAKILSIFSIDGLEQKFLDRGIYLKKLKSDYTFNQNKIFFKNGLVKGSELGLTFKGIANMREDFYDIEGTFIPAYTLNTLLTDLPIVGDIITAGSPEEGIIAANYKIKTVEDELDISFNPISAIVPNIIKNFLDLGESKNIREN